MCIKPRHLINLWFQLQVQHSPWTNLTFACKTEILGSLYSHALLILVESSKSKYQVTHEQKFKDLLSSTCQVSSERRVLDLEAETMRGPDSIPPGSNILSLDFFVFTLESLWHQYWHYCQLFLITKKLWTSPDPPRELLLKDQQCVTRQ